MHHNSSRRNILTSLAVGAAIAATALCGTALASQAPAYQTAQQAHRLKVEKAQYLHFLNSGPVHTVFHRVSAHEWANFSAEKPVSCTNLKAKFDQPHKWATFCATGGGGR